MINLKPLKGRVLVELIDKKPYKNLSTPVEKYNDSTEGIVIHGSTILDGKTVFWSPFVQYVEVKREGRKFGFIKIEDLDGSE